MEENEIKHKSNEIEEKILSGVKGKVNDNITDSAKAKTFESNDTSGGNRVKTDSYNKASKSTETGDSKKIDNSGKRVIPTAANHYGETENTRKAQQEYESQIRQHSTIGNNQSASSQSASSQSASSQSASSQSAGSRNSGTHADNLFNDREGTSAGNGKGIYSGSFKGNFEKTYSGTSHEEHNFSSNNGSSFNSKSTSSDSGSNFGNSNASSYRSQEGSGGFSSKGYSQQSGDSAFKGEFSTGGTVNSGTGSRNGASARFSGTASDAGFKNTSFKGSAGSPLTSFKGSAGSPLRSAYTNPSYRTDLVSSHKKIMFTGVTGSIAMKQRRAVTGMGRTAVTFAVQTTASNSGEAGQGLRSVDSAAKIAKAAGIAGGQMAYNVAALPGRISIKSQLPKNFDLGRANNVIQRYGFKRIGTNLTPSAMFLTARQNMGKAVKQGAPAELIEAYKNIATFAVYRRFRKRFTGVRMLKSAAMSVLFNTLTRDLQNTDAGEGAMLAWSFAQRGRNTLKRFVRLVKYQARGLLYTSRIATNLAMKMHLSKLRKAKKVLKSAKQLGDKATITAAKNTVLKHRKKVTRLGKRSKRIDKALKFSPRRALKAKIRKGLGKGVRKVGGWIGKGIMRVPGVKQILALFKRLGGRLAKTLIGKVAGRAAKVIGKIFAKINMFIGKIASFLGPVGWIASGLVFAIAFGFAVILLMDAGAVGADMSGDAKVNDCVDILKECYKDDMDIITTQNGASNIQFVDNRSGKYDDIIKARKENYKKSFYQSSNAAEILIMAWVKFDNDFGSVSNSERKDYLEGMWHGSHKITITTAQSEETESLNANGEATSTTVDNVSAVYETDYFGSLFNDRMEEETEVVTKTGDSESSNVTAYDADGEVNTNLEVYAYLRSKGFTHNAACGILANLLWETGGGQYMQDHYTLQQWQAVPKQKSLNPAMDDNSDGIGAWIPTYGWKQEVMKWINDNCDGNFTVKNELKYIIEDLDTGGHKGGKTAINGCSTPKDAGLWFANYYERCAQQYRAGRGDTAETLDLLLKQYEEEDAYSKLLKTDKIGNRIAKFASQFVGKLHYWGNGSTTRGLSLDTKNGGTDCSGFTFLVLRAVSQKFKLDYPDNSGAMTADGFYNKFKEYTIKASSAKPGDLVVCRKASNGTYHHIGIYVGNGQYVSMSQPNCGHGSEAYGPCPNDCKKTTPPSDSVYIRITKKYTD